MKATLYNKKEKKEIALPKEIFSVPVNADLVYQVVRAEMSNRRQNSAHAKDRSEVSGGGRKPWRQKGTGRARHGSRRSPIWVGGGVAFGPRNERNYKKKINKKVKRKALFMVLSGKLEKDLLFFTSLIEAKEPKTKIMRDFIGGLPVQGSTLILLPKMDKNVILSARNIDKVDTIQAKDINALDLLSYKNIIISEESLEVIKKTFLK